MTNKIIILLLGAVLFYGCASGPRKKSRMLTKEANQRGELSSDYGAGKRMGDMFRKQADE